MVANARLPLPEPNAVRPLIKSKCTVDQTNPYEKAQFAAEGWVAPTYERYPGACQRLKFAFGPIVVKPGQNDVLVQPITIEKPLYDGYITRFRPDLVYADGTVPPIDVLHLHHATWLNLTDNYGSGPFFAAGEEKTIANLPRGFGMPVKATDLWQLLYMVHSATPVPTVVWITYEIDYIAKKQAQSVPISMKAGYPIWLDVRPSGYPVFNVQRGFGSGGTCTWPAEQCANFDPYGKIIEGQGVPGNGTGRNWQFPAAGGSLGQIRNFTGGTIIGLGGHVHPGGLTNNIDLVRNGVAQRIYTGVAHYWDRTNPKVDGGPPTSWDFSMAITGLPRWGVHVQPGDILRSNATYDATQSTYENMGIVVGFIVPDAADGTPQAPHLDPFTAPFDPSPDCASGGLAAGTLCDKGVVTHGHLPESDHFGGPSGTLTTKTGKPVSQVNIINFIYRPGDFSSIKSMGIPTAKLGSSVRFFNWDSALDIYHTITSCGYPCTGETGTAFPLSNGTTNLDRAINFDSGELGYGIPEIGPAKQTAEWSLPLTGAGGYKPGEVLTYYCRIHPFMRGAVEVVD